MPNTGDSDTSQAEGVLDHSSDSELNTTVGSCSLREDLSSVSELLSKLKTYSPERKKATRYGKGQLPQTDRITKIIEYLDNIHNLNTKLVSKIDSLVEENTQLRQQIEMLQTPRSYAVAASATPLSPTAESAAPPRSTERPAPQELKMMNSKIDHLEQESLTNVIMLQGPAVENIVAGHSDRAPGSSGADGSNRNSKSAHLKAAVGEVLRGAAIPVRVDHIAAVWPQGRERKHLKVVCTSLESKIMILSTIRNIRPENIYANEYLTKHRSSLLYKLRNLKRQFPNITSVYSRNGVVCCKIRGTDRAVAVHDLADVNKIEEKMLNCRIS
jgi:hypothetical protein